LSDTELEKQEKSVPAALGGLIATLAVVLMVGAIAWSTDLFRVFGLVLYTQQFLIGMLAVSIPLVFLVYRVSGRRGGVPPWYDILAGVLGFGASVYMAARYPVLAEMVMETPADGLIVGTIILLVVVEGTRRTVGHVFTGVVVFFALLGLVGHLIPGDLQARYIPPAILFYTFAWDPTAMLGLPMEIVSTVVVSFVLFGHILLVSGGSEFFTELSMILVGRFRGGQAKIAVTASGMFGSISGSAVSNVATTGVITIPLMRNAGYDVHKAGAIEAVASTGGQLMPPIMGAAAFLMAEFLEVEYKEVVLAALIPAILYYVALFILADLEAAKSGIKAVDRAQIPRPIKVLREGWFFSLPFVALIYALFWLNMSPEKAALLSAVVIVICSAIFGYKGKRLKPMEVYAAVRDTGIAVLDIIMIGAAAGVVIGALGITGLAYALTQMLISLGGGNMLLLLLVSAVVCIILGMGMPTAGVYILLSTLVASSLVEVGILPMAAHLFILYFGMMSMITPPVAIAAFAAASLSGADAMKTGLAAMKFGWLAYLIPFLFVFSPELIMQGAPAAIVLAAITAAVGVWLVSVAIIGYFSRPLNVLFRLLFALAGLGLLVPASAFDGAHVTDIAGLILGIVLVGREFLFARQARAVTSRS